MIQIHPDQVVPAFASMFTRDMPTGIRALAVLADRNAGKIFTDDPLHPHWGLVWEADDGTLYRGSQVHREIFSEAVTLLRQEDIVALAFRRPSRPTRMPALSAWSSTDPPAAVIYLLSWEGCQRVTHSTAWIATSWNAAQSTMEPYAGTAASRNFSEGASLFASCITKRQSAKLTQIWMFKGCARSA